MKYVGSKRRIWKHIAPFILANRAGRPYVEPFVGGGNSICNVSGGIRIGGDINRYAIDALISIRDYLHDLPRNNEEFTEADYYALRKSDNYRHKGYAGFAFAFGSKWLTTWAKDADNTDYVQSGYNSACLQSPLLQGVHLFNCSYKDLLIPDDSIVYCDPPYMNTTGYGANNRIDAAEFWDWCAALSRRCEVFVSEYDGPPGLEPIWEMPIKYMLNINRTKQAVEKLFYMGRHAVPVKFTNRMLQPDLWPAETSRNGRVSSFV